MKVLPRCSIFLSRLRLIFRIWAISLFLFIFIQSISAQDRTDRIRLQSGQEIFLSGMNLAWINFAQDLTDFNETEFIRALDEISAAGGNTIRWWLHVDGTASPVFKDDSVTTITKTELQNLQRALNLAQDHQVGLVLCLWSFDMLRTSLGATIIRRNKLMLTNDIYMHAYINNALIPMIVAVDNHPAVICWEVFNEAEGMSNEYGWQFTQHVPIANIQKFVNRIAGTIHRRIPGVLVSNSCWCFMAATDIDGFTNRYTDERLIAAGGDKDGILDFYMVHYYAWEKEKTSPFHHPGSYWQLDKPVVIAEFSAKGPYEGIDAQKAYGYLYDNGYAGALSWTWTGHDGNGGVKEATPGMNYLRNNHAADIVIPEPGVILSFTANSTTISSGDSVLLNWVTSTGSRVMLNDHPVAQHDSVYVTPTVSTKYQLIASGKSQADTACLKITLNPR
jgi:hypothetical protein